MHTLTIARELILRSPVLLLTLLAFSLMNCSSCSTNDEDEKKPKNTNVPCFGDPYFHPQLARQRVSGTAGARFGQARNGGTRWHHGIDLEIKDGKDLFAMYDGYVYDIGEMTGYGNYVIYLSRVKGEAVMIMYAHIQRCKVSVGTFVKAGDVIATSGRTGNLEEAIAGDYVNPHVHIEIRLLDPDSTFIECSALDPEDFMGTELDAAGYPRNKRACHDEY